MLSLSFFSFPRRLYVFDELTNGFPVTALLQHTANNSLRAHNLLQLHLECPSLPPPSIACEKHVFCVIDRRLAVHADGRLKLLKSI